MGSKYGIIIINIILWGTIFVLIVRSLLKNVRIKRKTQGEFGAVTKESKEEILYAVKQFVMMKKNPDAFSYEEMRNDPLLKKLYKQNMLMQLLRAVLYAQSVAILTDFKSERGSITDEPRGIMSEPVRSIVIYHGKDGVLNVGYLSYYDEAEEFGQNLADTMNVPFVVR